MKNHLHVYAAAQLELNAPATLSAAQRDKLAKRIDLQQISRLVAVAYSTLSQEHNTDLVIPQVGETDVRRFEIVGPSAGGQLLSQLAEFASEKDAPLTVRFVAKDGAMLRHVIRWEALKSGQSLVNVPAELYFGTATFSWTSVLGPETQTDAEAMVMQLGLGVTADDHLERELETTVRLYGRAGLISSDMPLR